jgi:hypothetical protein
MTDEQPFKLAHERLKDASRICFLGFGYDPTNMDRLLQYSPAGRSEVYGCAVGFTSRECDLIRSEFNKHGLHTIPHLEWHFLDSLPFLRATCPFD